MTTISTTVTPLTGSFTADPDHSSFQAELRHMGVGRFRTGFEEVEARLETLPGGGHRLTGVAQVESISIRRPAEFRAHVVEGEDFFNVGSHPQLRFTSADIRYADDGTVAVSGELTMRGVTRPVSATGTFLPAVEDPYGGRRAALDLSAVIDRRDWGFDFQAQLPGGGDVLSWSVELSVHLELIAD